MVLTLVLTFVILAMSEVGGSKAWSEDSYPDRYKTRTRPVLSTLQHGNKLLFYSLQRPSDSLSTWSWKSADKDSLAYPLIMLKDKPKEHEAKAKDFNVFVQKMFIKYTTVTCPVLVVNDRIHNINYTHKFLCSIFNRPNFNKNPKSCFLNQELRLGFFDLAKSKSSIFFFLV